MSTRKAATTANRWRARLNRLPLLAVVLLTGCGGADPSNGSASDAARRTISFPIRRETHEDIVAAVEACREGVDLATWLPKAGKTELHEACDRGLKRGLTEVRQYAEEVCTEVVFTMPSSSQAEKKRVLDACEAKTKPFAPHRKRQPLPADRGTPSGG
jgi:hypothetical protein